jgi:small subunit ribosomal protein S16
MALKIRLARGGAKKRPFYRIVVAEASSPRDGRYVERVGTYNPMVPKDHDQRLIINGERITFWLGKGAKPTERVQKMLASAGLMAAPVLRDQPKKSAPGKKRAEREAEAVEAAAAAAEAAAAEAEAAAAAEAEAAAEAPVEEAPAEDAPAEDAPAEDAPAEDAPAAEAPAEEAGAEDAPAAEAGEEKAGN